MIATIAIH